MFRTIILALVVTVYPAHAAKKKAAPKCPQELVMTALIRSVNEAPLKHGSKWAARYAVRSMAYNKLSPENIYDPSWIYTLGHIVRTAPYHQGCLSIEPEAVIDAYQRYFDVAKPEDASIVCEGLADLAKYAMKFSNGAIDTNSLHAVAREWNCSKGNLIKMVGSQINDRAIHYGDRSSPKIGLRSNPSYDGLNSRRKY